MNGYEVEVVDYSKDETGNFVDVLGIMKIDDDFAYSIWLRDETIKTIVTHEQFEQIKYKVKEN